ncbi:hypothetical protein ACSYAD_23100 [Acaryochloris marina NIES-2412]
MTRKSAIILGLTLGFFLGVSGVCFWYFSRPVAPPVVIQVEEA